MLSVALTAQYGFGLAPCELCIKQRIPYAVIIVVGLLAAYVAKSERARLRALFSIIALFVIDACIAFYHAGVESGVFKAPDACSSESKGGETLEELRAAIMNAPLVTCDQPMIHVLGLSMAAWNAIAATALALMMAVMLTKLRKSV